MLEAANLQTRFCPSCEGYISQFCLFLRKAAGPGWADDWFYGRLWSLMGKSAHHRRNEGWRSFVAGTPRLSVPIAGFLSSSNFLQHFLISLEVKVVLPFWGKPFWCFENIHHLVMMDQNSNGVVLLNRRRKSYLLLLVGFHCTFTIFVFNLFSLK